MRLPRDVSGRDVAVALEVFGYEIVRQRGSHLRLVSQQQGQHHLVIPDHRPLKVGTLSSILKEVAEHHGMSRDELIEKLAL